MRIYVKFLFFEFPLRRKLSFIFKKECQFCGSFNRSGGFLDNKFFCKFCYMYPGINYLVNIGSQETRLIKWISRVVNN
jgi:hypothetical protein